MTQASPPQLEDNIRIAHDFTRREGQHLIAGVWRDGRSDARITVLNPASEEVLTHIPHGTEEDVAEAVAAARTSFDDARWRGLPAAERERRLLRLADLVERHTEEIAAIETLDNGVPLTGALRGVVPMAISSIRYHAGWIRRLGGDVVPVSVPGEWHGYTERVPLGVAALILPWNAPFPMTCTKVSAALAAGCSVVIKPPELAPLSTLRLGELIAEAGIPDGVVNIVLGDGVITGSALIRHKDVDKISFTGSTATGKLILSETIGTLKRVSLELGGKSPVVVYPDADLARAVPGVAMGIFGNSGQVCAAGSRLFLHEEIYDAFLERLAAFAEGLTVGNGLKQNTVMGPLISSAQRERVMGYIKSGIEEGATLLTGGSAPSGPGYFVQPTIFKDVSPEMRIVREEIFGPVLSVMKFGDDDIETLARRCNDTIYGLSAYIWTQNLDNAFGLSKLLKAGSVKINGAGMEFTLPFGGFKQSGHGRENGQAGIETFTEIRSVMLGYRSPE